MKAAYIGILTPGSTSRMRAEWLRRVTPDWEWDWVDTDPPLLETSRLWQSLAYRYQVGKAVTAVNDAVREWIGSHSVDLAWVDKAIFLRPNTVSLLRRSAGRLVHFTPDTAFHANRSRNFEQTVREFDLLVTTKSFEVADYARRLDSDTLFVTTQGFDPIVHYPRRDDAERVKEVCFIGLAEPDRERCLQTLLEHSVPVSLAGVGWQAFLKKWGDHPRLRFGGEHVFGDRYAEMLSRAWIGLGLVSKRFPELHTTRTFEIPACGGVLATEMNNETRNFFRDDEALFFSDYDELAHRITDLFAASSGNDLELIAERGRARVLNDRRDYPSILTAILADQRLTSGS